MSEVTLLWRVVDEQRPSPCYMGVLEVIGLIVIGPRQSVHASSL